MAAVIGEADDAESGQQREHPGGYDFPAKDGEKDDPEVPHLLLVQHSTEMHRLEQGDVGDVGGPQGVRRVDQGGLQYAADGISNTLRGPSLQDGDP